MKGPMAMRLTALAAATSLLFACTSEAPGTAKEAAVPATAATAKGPALWKVADADTTIYLFGTVHMLPDGTQWLRPAIEKAFNASDTLILEVIGTDDASKTAPVIMKLGFSPGQPPLAERVPQAERAALAAAIRDAGVPAAALDAMETWLATMSLSTARIQKFGYAIDSGVESELKGRAAAQRKAIAGLETMEEQLGFFDTLPEADQRLMLANSLDDMDEIGALVTQVVDDWQAGNVEAVANMLEEDIKASPALAKRLLADRNANWAKWIESRLQTTPGTVFIAVGSGHLAGKDSVQAMLAARQLRVERLN